MVHLYHAVLTRSVRIYWLLEELGIPYTIVPVVFSPPGRPGGVRSEETPNTSPSARSARCRRFGMEVSPCSSPVRSLRVSDHRERQDRAIVNTQIGIVNAKIGHREHLDRAS